MSYPSYFHFTHTLPRFDGALNVDLNEFQTNLVNPVHGSNCFGIDCLPSKTHKTANRCFATKTAMKSECRFPLATYLDVCFPQFYGPYFVFRFPILGFIIHWLPTLRLCLPRRPTMRPWLWTPSPGASHPVPSPSLNHENSRVCSSLSQGLLRSREPDGEM